MNFKTIQFTVFSVTRNNRKAPIKESTMSNQENAINPSGSVLPSCSADERMHQAHLINFALNSLKQDILESMKEDKGRTCRDSHHKDSIAKIEKIKAEYHVTTEELLHVANLAIEENQNRCPDACRHSYRHSIPKSYQHTISKPSPYKTVNDILLIVLIILFIILSTLLIGIYIKHTSINHRQQLLKEKTQISEIIHLEDIQVAQVNNRSIVPSSIPNHIVESSETVRIYPTICSEETVENVRTFTWLFKPLKTVTNHERRAESPNSLPLWRKARP